MSGESPTRRKLAASSPVDVAANSLAIGDPWLQRRRFPARGRDECSAACLFRLGTFIQASCSASLTNSSGLQRMIPCSFAKRSAPSATAYVRDNSRENFPARAGKGFLDALQRGPRRGESVGF